MVNWRLHGGGRVFCTVGQLVSGVTALAGGGLGEADAVAGGEDDVGVVQDPVDGGVGDGFGGNFAFEVGVRSVRVRG